MLDIKLLRENPEKVKKGVADKKLDPSLVDEVLELDKKRRDLLGEIEGLRAERNKLSSKEHVASSRGKEIKDKLKELEPQLREVENEFKEALWNVPNLPADDVKVGKDESDNEVIRSWGKPRDFGKDGFEPKDHLELGKKLGILDFEAGAKVAGSQFYFFYGDGAKLELALIQYVFEVLEKEGFTPVITPDLAKSRFYVGTGYLPKGDEAQTYAIENEDLGLVATAEVTLAGKHADDVLCEKDLPLKYIGYSHCFRQEAGAYGKYSKGLYRVHQFTKAEMFIYCAPEESEKYHQHIVEMEEKILQGLGLPYRVVQMCTGDLSAMSAKTYDIEAWMPGRGEYGEVTSASNCTDYQARNLNIKFQRKGGLEFVHMLNGTAIATSRTPLAILENYQQKDGSIVIPEVLRKWMEKDRITSL